MQTETSANLQAIIAKVAKLRALAKNNSSVHEAQAAAADADKLIQEHRIVEAQIESDEKSEESGIEAKDAFSAGKRSLWKEIILGSLVRSYECSWYISISNEMVSPGKYAKRLSYRLVGRKDDIELVEYMYGWIVSELERICKIHHKGKGLGAAMAFYEGAATGFAQALKKAKEESRQQAASTALVRLEQREEQARTWVRQNVGTLKSVGALAGSRSKGSEAWHHGYQTGQSMNAPNAMNGAVKNTARIA